MASLTLSKVLPGLLLIATACNNDDAELASETNDTGGTEAGTQSDTASDDAADLTGDEPSEPACVSGATTIELPTQTIPSTGGSGTTGVAANRAGWFAVGESSELLIHYQVADEQAPDGVSTIVAWVSTDGRTGELGAYPGRSSGSVVRQFIAAPLWLGDTRCAVVAGRDFTAHLMCEDGTEEDTGIEIRHDVLIPVVADDGTVSVFAQTFAAYTELRRSPDGEWREIEKYAGSISAPGDAVLVDGSAMSCFFYDSSGLVRLDYRGQEPAEFTGGPCHLAYEGNVLHVLTADGYARTMASLGWNPVLMPTPVDAPVRELLAIDQEPFAIVYDSDAEQIQRVHLPDSEPVPLVPHNAIVHFDPATATLGAAYSDVDFAADLQTITVETFCPEEWVD